MQHAWAELAHDRKYKFSGKLPHELERKLYLYAGLLEIADKGFDETAQALDDYSRSLPGKTAKGDLNIEITTLSLESYTKNWAKENNLNLRDLASALDLNDLIDELNQFGINTIANLDRIANKEYAQISNESGRKTTIYGLIRDWMLIDNWRKFVRDVNFNWIMDDSSALNKFIPPDEYEEFKNSFQWADADDFEFEDSDHHNDEDLPF